MGLFYFIDVFVGMFLIQSEYSSNAEYFFDTKLRQSKLLERPYDIIEFVLLGAFVIEDIIKLAFTTRQSKRVIYTIHIILQFKARECFTIIISSKLFPRQP